MSTAIHVLFILLSSFSYAISDDQEESKVMILTEENFDRVIQNTPLIMVEFYAPWCEYCQIFEPKYEAAAEELSHMKPPIPLAKVNGDEQKNLYNRMGLNGYPTIFVFHNGRHFLYERRRRTDEVVEFMKEEAKPDWKPPEDHVTVLTTDNFTDSVYNEDLMLVEFYAPWCGHCKRLAPDYALAAKELNLKHNIPLAKVDATEETAIAKEFGVDGYPTLFIFRQGKRYDYTGPRDREGIVEFMKNQSIPATRYFNTRKELDYFVTSSLAPIIVAVLPSGEEESFWNTYFEVANLARETPIHFWHTSDKSLSRGLGLPSDSGIVILRPPRFRSRLEPILTVYKGLDVGKSTSTIVKEIEELAKPLVGLRTQTSEKWWGYPFLVAYLSIDTSTDGIKDFQFWRNRLLEAKNTVNKPINFVMSDEIEYAEELGELGLKDQGEEVVIALFGGPKEKYSLKDEFAVDSVVEFVQSYFEGELHPILRSQRKPREQNGPVKVVVGSTFEEIVYDSEKDVLVEFYAPWCGHCKNLEPKFKQLAKKYSKYDNLVIAKFDATENDAPPTFEYKGFPSIFFVPAGNLRQVVKYESGREVSDFSSFLNEHAVHSLGQREKSEL